MSINLYFSSHYGGALTTGLLRQLFAEADVVLVEHAFQDEGDLTLNMFNELSRGNLLIEDVQNVMSGIGGQDHPEFDREIKSLIFRSEKRILIEKPPHSAYDFRVVMDRLDREYRNMRVVKATHKLTEDLVEYANYQKKRDEALADQIITLAHSEATSNILVIRGLEHKANLERALIERNTNARSFLSHEWIPLTFTDDVVKKLLAGERPHHRDLLLVLAERTETRTNSFQITKASVQAVRDHLGEMSEKQLEKLLKKRLNLT
jgi:hypothetical protein